jgi:DNA-binding NtrC family response regulator
VRRILVATHHNEIKTSIGNHLKGRYLVDLAGSGEECLQKMGKKHHDILFVDLDFLKDQLPSPQSEDYGPALKSLRKPFSQIPMVVLTAHESIRRAVTAIRSGADDYLIYPIDPLEVELVIDRLKKQRKIESELVYWRESFWKAEAQSYVRTLSPLMRQVYEKRESVAPTKATVLLTGDTGTGKSLVAKLLHMHSKRAEGPFIPVHCGSIPETLVESELFGHEKGAFTGAERRKLGKFEIADKGTIFLDEIGTISPNAQIKLLQVLQESSFSRVGGEKTIQVDVRVVAASNEDLQTRIEQDKFRKDLFFRLNVFSLEIPPLKERREDIPFLLDGILGQLNRTYGKAISEVDGEVLQAFQSYNWPGNIRELENLLERAYILEKTGDCLGWGGG